MATIHRRTSAERRTAARYRKKYNRLVRHKSNGRLTTKVRTSHQKSAVARLKVSGFFKKINKLRETVANFQVTEGVTTHTEEFISLVLESAATLDGKDGLGDPRAFANHYMSKAPWYSNSQVGLCALAFEAYLCGEHGELAKRYVESVVEATQDTFLIVFEGKISDEEWEQIENEVDFADFDILVEAGDIDPDNSEVADITIIEVTPTAENIEVKEPEDATDVAPDNGEHPVLESLTPSTPAAYEAIAGEGGITTPALSALFAAEVTAQCERSGASLVWEDPNGVLWTLGGERWLPLAETIANLSEDVLNEGPPEDLLIKYAVPGKSVMLPDNCWWTITSRDIAKDKVILKLSDYAKKDGTSDKPNKELSWGAFKGKAGKAWGISLEGKQYGPKQDKEKRAKLRAAKGKRAAPGMAKDEAFEPTADDIVSFLTELAAPYGSTELTEDDLLFQFESKADATAFNLLLAGFKLDGVLEDYEPTTALHTRMRATKSATTKKYNAKTAPTLRISRKDPRLATTRKLAKNEDESAPDFTVMCISEGGMIEPNQVHVRTHDTDKHTVGYRTGANLASPSKHWTGSTFSDKSSDAKVYPSRKEAVVGAKAARKHQLTECDDKEAALFAPKLKPGSQLIKGGNVIHGGGGTTTTDEALTEAKWSADVKTKWTPPKGFFEQGSAQIAKGLLAASSSTKQATDRLNFYINRAGKNLSDDDKGRLNAAKAKLTKSEESLSSEARGNLVAASYLKRYLSEDAALSAIALNKNLPEDVRSHAEGALGKR